MLVYMILYIYIYILVVTRASTFWPSKFVFFLFKILPSAHIESPMSRLGLWTRDGLPNWMPILFYLWYDNEFMGTSELSALSCSHELEKHPFLERLRHAAKEQIVGEIWFQINSGGRKLLGRFGQCPEWLLLVREMLGLHGHGQRAM